MFDVEHNLAALVGNFLYRWQYQNWSGLNPGCRPFEAKDQPTLLSLIRCSVPAMADVRVPRIANAVQEAGYKIIPTDDGVRIDRDLEAVE